MDEYRVTVINLQTGQCWEDNVRAECADDARADAYLVPLPEIYGEEADD